MTNETQLSEQTETRLATFLDNWEATWKENSERRAQEIIEELADINVGPEMRATGADVRFEDHARDIVVAWLRQNGWVK